MGERSKRIAQGLRRWMQHPQLPWHLALLAMLLCAPSLWLGLQLDDHFHRAALTRPDWEFLSNPPDKLFAFIKGEEEVTREMVALGRLPWWTHERLRLSFYRPLTGLTHWLDYTIWPQFPWLMHLHSLLWLGAVVAAAAFLFRRMLIPVWIAGLAALLFAVDDAHGWPAVWLANRNTLIAGFFGILCLIAHDRWRKDGWRPGAILAPASFLLALLAKESAVAVGAYIFAYALFIERGALLRRLISILPCALVGLAWAVAYSRMGYGATGSGMYIDPATDPLAFGMALVRKVPLLLLGQWFGLSDLNSVLSEQGVRIMWLAAMGFLAMMTVALIPLIRRDSLARFWTLGMLLSLPPVCATVSSDRLLMFAGIGGMGLLAQFMSGLWERADWLPVTPWWRRPARSLGVLMVIAHLILAPISLTHVTTNIERFGNVMERAAASLPSDASIESQSLIIVNTPSNFLRSYAALIHGLKGLPFPESDYVLGSGIHAMEVRRPDEHTLLIRPEGGFLARPGSPVPGKEDELPLFDVRYIHQWFDRLYRDDEPMPAGTRLELDGLTVEITKATEAGRPLEVAFRFHRKLEDPFFRWMKWENGGYVPFALPAVGETVTLPPASIPY
jgi:hypothetical protein